MYYDSRSTRDKPLWQLVDICFVRKFKEIVTLAQIKADKRFEKMLLTQQGSRLSVQPVGEVEFKAIIKMGT